MNIRKDEGYAWIVAAASAVVMLIGPSTYSSYGLFFSKVDLSYSQRIWICQLMYILWSLMALLAGPLSSIFAHRRVVMIGCFISACGLSITAITLKNPAISFLTFSTLVGIGLGLAYHATFLLVSAHFRKHRGFATGIGIFSAGIGQALAPVICRPLMESKNVFYIRALMTAIAFMSSSLYISPHTNARDQEKQNLKNENSTDPTVNILKSNKNGTVLEVIIAKDVTSPIQKLSQKNEMFSKSGSRNTDTRLKSKKTESHLLAGVSKNLLPKISEESEISPFLHRKEYNKNSPVRLLSLEENKTKAKEINMALVNKFCILPIDDELDKRIAKTIEKSKCNKNTTTKSGSLGPGFIHSSPDLIRKNFQIQEKPTEVSHQIKLHVIRPLSPELIAKISRKCQGEKIWATSIQNNKGKHISQNLISPSSNNCNSLPMTPTNNSQTLEVFQDTEKNEKKGLPLWHELFDRIEFSFLFNFRFLNICIPCVLSILFAQNFPIVLSSYMISVQLKGSYVEESVNNTNLSSTSMYSQDQQHFRNSGIGLVIIFILDMITRLGMSYLSDLSFFSRRWLFLAGSFGSAIICLAICEIEDMVTIYIFCAAFGICFGTMMVTESLMLVETFGIKKLSSCYGLMNTIKVVFVLLLYPIQSPISTFMYNFHPLKSIQTLNGTSAAAQFDDFDPLGLFLSIESPDTALLTDRHWLRVLSAPGFLLIILWTLELIYDRHLHRPCHFRTYSRHHNPQNFRPNFANRSNSNPFL